MLTRSGGERLPHKQICYLPPLPCSVGTCCWLPCTGLRASELLIRGRCSFWDRPLGQLSLTVFTDLPTSALCCFSLAGRPVLSQWPIPRQPQAAGGPRGACGLPQAAGGLHPHPRHPRGPRRPAAAPLLLLPAARPAEVQDRGRAGPGAGSATPQGGLRWPRVAGEGPGRGSGR